MTLFQRLMLLLCLTAFTAACASLSANPAPQQVNPRAAAIKEFDDRIREFRELHKKLQSQLNDPIQPSNDAAKLNEGENRMRAAIRQARAHAKQGEFFTPAVAPVFRDIITAHFQGENPKLETSAQDRPPAMKLSVNERWPQSYPVPTMPPTLLANLPKLPDDFAYRFADRTLVLLDVDTDLVLDYLPAAAKLTTTK